jgi:transposase
MVSKRRRSRLPGGIQQELVRRFVAGTYVRSAAELCGVNRNTAIQYFHKLRELIAENLAADALDLMAGEIEVDESYFGGVRRGKRGRGAVGKIPVFGLL